jgi:DNA-binding NtrC family response regulator
MGVEPIFASSGSAPTILIVDNEQDVSLLCDSLCDQDLSIDISSDTSEALLRICSGQYDVVVTEFNDRYPGLEILQHTRHVSPYTGTLILTAAPSLESALKAWQSGAVGYLVKPCSATTLRSAVADALGYRQMHLLRSQLDLLSDENARLTSELKERRMQHRHLLDILTTRRHELTRLGIDIEVLQSEIQRHIRNGPRSEEP